MSVSLKSKDILQDLKILMTNRRNTKFSGPTIIYCRTKKTTSVIVKLLKSNKVNCDQYHADLEINVRKSIQQKFLDNQIDVSHSSEKFFF